MDWIQRYKTIPFYLSFGGALSLNRVKGTKLESIILIQLKLGWITGIYTLVSDHERTIVSGSQNCYLLLGKNKEGSTKIRDPLWQYIMWWVSGDSTCKLAHCQRAYKYNQWEFLDNYPLGGATVIAVILYACLHVNQWWINIISMRFCQSLREICQIIVVGCRVR